MRLKQAARVLGVTGRPAVSAPNSKAPSLGGTRSLDAGLVFRPAQVRFEQRRKAARCDAEEHPEVLFSTGKI